LNTHRSNYKQTLKVLKEIAQGLDSNEIKSKLFLSRYSFNYTVNRLLSNDLVEYSEGVLVVSRKGYNILKFEQEYPETTVDDPRIASAIYNIET
jgi:hypothetical protein